MNGAEALMSVAKQAGIEICFANPGTTEMPMVMAMDSEPGIRPVLSLHENVCSGAADAYGRLAGKPAMTITHLGPGFANSCANQHNARRAFAPVFNVIGQHATWHYDADAPLGMDILGLAGTVSDWVRETANPASVAQDIVDGITFALGQRGRVASLSFPHDHQDADVTANPVLGKPEPLGAIDSKLVDQACAALKNNKKTAILLGGTALKEAGLMLAAKLKAAHGCDLVIEGAFSQMECGAGLPDHIRLPYLPEPAQALMDAYEQVIVVGTKLPVSFFGWPGGAPSQYLRDRDGVVHVAGQVDDAVAALDGMVQGTGAAGATPSVTNLSIPDMPTGTLTPDLLCQTFTAMQPENAVIVPTAVTTGRLYGPMSTMLPRHTQISLCGGAIGEGPALALGAAIACPDRPVLNLQADGSGAYLPQAFWSQAREGANITTVICSNRRYAILQGEMTRAGMNQPGEHSMALTQLDNPPLDWVAIAKGFGVPGEVVSTCEDLAKAMKRGMATPGPYLIEARI
jgi:acetolactate synthase-1/2/3 large subunit